MSDTKCACKRDDASSESEASIATESLQIELVPVVIGSTTYHTYLVERRLNRYEKLVGEIVETLRANVLKYETIVGRDATATKQLREIVRSWIARRDEIAEDA